MYVSLLTNEEKETGVTVSPITKYGNPAPIDGALTITPLTGDSDAQITLEADGTLTLISATTEGSADFEVSADADLGEGVTTIVEKITIVTSIAGAVGLGVAGGVKEAK